MDVGDIDKGILATAALLPSRRPMDRHHPVCLSQQANDATPQVIEGVLVVGEDDDFHLGPIRRRHVLRLEDLG